MYSFGSIIFGLFLRKGKFFENTIFLFGGLTINLINLFYIWQVKRFQRLWTIPIIFGITFFNFGQCSKIILHFLEIFLNISKILMILFLLVLFLRMSHKCLFLIPIPSMIGMFLWMLFWWLRLSIIIWTTLKWDPNGLPIFRFQFQFSSIAKHIHKFLDNLLILFDHALIGTDCLIN